MPSFASQHGPFSRTFHAQTARVVCEETRSVVQEPSLFRSVSRSALELSRSALEVSRSVLGSRPAMGYDCSRGWGKYRTPWASRLQAGVLIHL